MKVKEILEQPGRLQEQINRNSSKIEYYRSQMGGISSMGFEAAIPSSNPNTRSPQECFLALVMELEEEIKTDKALQEKSIMEAIDLIGQLENPNQWKALSLRYIGLFNVSDVAYRMNFSLRWTKQLLSDGLKALETKEENNELL